MYLVTSNFHGQGKGYCKGLILNELDEKNLSKIMVSLVGSKLIKKGSFDIKDQVKGLNLAELKALGLSFDVEFKVLSKSEGKLAADICEAFGEQPKKKVKSK